MVDLSDLEGRTEETAQKKAAPGTVEIVENVRKRSLGPPRNSEGASERETGFLLVSGLPDSITLPSAIWAKSVEDLSGITP